MKTTQKIKNCCSVKLIQLKNRLLTTPVIGCKCHTSQTTQVTYQRANIRDFKTIFVEGLPFSYSGIYTLLLTKKHLTYKFLCLKVNEEDFEVKTISVKFKVNQPLVGLKDNVFEKEYVSYSPDFFKNPNKAIEEIEYRIIEDLTLSVKCYLNEYKK